MRALSSKTRRFENSDSDDQLEDLIKLLIVERRLVDRSRIEEIAAIQQANTRGIPVVQSSIRGLRLLDITQHTLCVGSVPFVREALLKTGGLPAHAPYPESLSPYLQREVGFSPRLRDLIVDGGFPIFVKPAEGWKRFTGAVLDHGDSARELGISLNQSVWWSEKVAWASEWRAYCVSGHVLDLQRVPHTPPEGPAVDLKTVETAALVFHRAGGGAGVILDFGVLSTGQTALVEANDGFSFGAYGTVDPSTLWQIWAARWPELVLGDTPSTPRANPGL